MKTDFTKHGYDIRKSPGGWSVDVKTGKYWLFEMKFSTKRDAINYIIGKINYINT